MNLQRLLSDHNVPFVTEGHAHSTEGWVNVHCPFCPGSREFHLGLHNEGTGAHCWRCGAHSAVDVLSRLLNVPKARVFAILRQYKGVARRGRPAKVNVSIMPLKFPAPNSSLAGPYKQYLRKRGFDPEHIEREWGVRQTGPVSLLDGISYNYRILIPIHWDGEMVSFQARDITNKSDAKYLACPKKRERIHHKNIVYGKQEEWGNSDGIIVVEGVTDVWRLGTSAVAMFGMEFKMEQVMRLARIHDKFFIIFDSEPQAQKQAGLLATKLRVLGKTAQVERVKGDPGGMKQDDAGHLVKELLK